MADDYFRLALYYFIILSSVAMGAGLLRTKNTIGRLWGMSMLARGVEFTFLALLLVGMAAHYQPLTALRGALLTSSAVFMTLVNAALIWKFQIIDREIKQNGGKR